jgi:hypothetical protein
MTDQMSEQISIGHPRDRRCKKRRVYLCPREDPVREHAKQAVWKEMVVHVDAQRPRITGKRPSRGCTHSRFEAQRLQREGHSLDVRAAYKYVDVDEIPPAPQGRPPPQQEHALQWHQHDATLRTCLEDLIR